MAVLTYDITAQSLINKLKEHHLVTEFSQNVDFAGMHIEHITYDSREVLRGSLFICKGFGFKEEFLDRAIAKGAMICITESIQICKNKQIAYIVVSDVRKAMSIVALEYHAYCYQKLQLVGLTGTKGKTTTSYFLHNILNCYVGEKTGLLSTVEVFTGKESVEAHLTTPESLDLHRLFGEMLSYDIAYVTMEVSSQAYKMQRVYGMQFAYGMFINIGEDHIGPQEHEDFEDYFGCKLEFVKNCKNMIINKGTEHYNRVRTVADAHCEMIVTYGLTADCDYYAENIVPEKGGFSFDVVSLGYRKRFFTKMAGRFNIENALGAIALAKTMGIEERAIYEGVRMTTVMGRMNLFAGNDITVIVDYAHNHVSFTKLYESLKLDYPGRRLVVLFGCPGGKAQLRRRDIGTLTAHNADYIYLTAEDPQFENVLDICNDIASFITPYNTPFEIIEDREKAIEKAILQAQSGDLVLLAAKGEELYQKVKGEYVYYPSDYKLAEKFLRIRDEEGTV